MSVPQAFPSSSTHLFSILTQVQPMFVERKVRYSVLFTNLVGWHAGAISFHLSDIILAQLVCPLSDVMFCLHSGITNLSLYKYWLQPHFFPFYVKHYFHWQRFKEKITLASVALLVLATLGNIKQIEVILMWCLHRQCGNCNFDE
jgi:hypothetical protein